jgi:hypothetical protein
MLVVPDLGQTHAVKTSQVFFYTVCTEIANQCDFTDILRYHMITLLTHTLNSLSCLEICEHEFYNIFQTPHINFVAFDYQAKQKRRVTTLECYQLH